MGREQRFLIYRLTSPSGKTYVGYTGQTIKRRFRQHELKALSGVKHPLSSALRKYGADNFTVEVLSTHATVEEAFEEEIAQIALHAKGYNLSVGGEEDLREGRASFKKKLQDPVWKAEYGKRLSIAIKNSERHKRSWLDFPARAARWREENPEEAERIQKKATEAARKFNLGKPAVNRGVPHKKETCEKLSISIRAFWASASAEKRKSKSAASVRGAKKQWAQRSEEEKLAVAKKISESLKRMHANLTVAERAARDTTLIETRKNIDHEFRKAKQRKSFETYWTPERRKAKAEQSRAHHLALKLI